MIEKFTGVALKETQKPFFTAVALEETQKPFFYGCRPRGKSKRKMHDYFIHVVRACDREVYGCRPQGNAKNIFLRLSRSRKRKKPFFTAVALTESSNAKCTTILYMESEHVIEKFTAVALKETQKNYFLRRSPSRKVQTQNAGLFDTWSLNM